MFQIPRKTRVCEYGCRLGIFWRGIPAGTKRDTSRGYLPLRSSLGVLYSVRLAANREFTADVVILTVTHTCCWLQSLIHQVFLCMVQINVRLIFSAPLIPCVYLIYQALMRPIAQLRLHYVNWECMKENVCVGVFAYGSLTISKQLNL